MKKLFLFLAIIILIIAIVNYINLITSRSEHRNKEVGIRKVVGASKNKLRAQFLSESVFLSLLSLTFSPLLFVIVMQLLLGLMLPSSKSLSGRRDRVINYCLAQHSMPMLLLSSSPSVSDQLEDYRKQLQKNTEYYRIFNIRVPGALLKNWRPYPGALFLGATGINWQN